MELCGCQDGLKEPVLLSPTAPPRLLRGDQRAEGMGWGPGDAGQSRDSGAGGLSGKVGACPCSPRDTWHGQEPLAEPQLSTASEDPGDLSGAAHRSCSSFPLGRGARGCPPGNPFGIWAFPQVWNFPCLWLRFPRWI